MPPSSAVDDRLWRPSPGLPVDRIRLRSTAEKEIAQSAAHGRFKDFSAVVERAEREIRADVVRGLLLGEHRGLANSQHDTHPHGLRLRGVLIEDTAIDVSGCSAVLPIHFIGCTIKQISARHVSMTGDLILEDCQITEGIDLAGCDLRSVRILDCKIGTLRNNPHGPLRNNPHGPEPRWEENQPVPRWDDEPTAVDASTCRVRGNFILGRTELRGALTIMDAEMDCVMLDRVRTAPRQEGEPSLHRGLVGDRVRVDGSMNIERCDFAESALRLPGSEIGSQLVVAGVSAGSDAKGISAFLQDVHAKSMIWIGAYSSGATVVPTKLAGELAMTEASTGRAKIMNASMASVDARGVTADVAFEVGPGANIQDEFDLDCSNLGRCTFTQTTIGRSGWDRRDRSILKLRSSNIRSDLELKDGTKIFRPVDLRHIRIGADLLINGPREIPRTPPRGQGELSPNSAETGTILRSGPHGKALQLEFGRVHGKLQIDQAVVDGAVLLNNATIGQVCISRAVVGASLGDAINADRCRVDGPVVLGPGLITRGPVQIEDAQAGYVDICAEISSRGERGEHGECACEPSCGCVHQALSLARSRVSSDVRLNPEVRTDGSISLFGLDVGGSLDVNGTRINAQDDNGASLNAYRAHIAGDLKISGDFRAEGSVVLRGACIGGSLTVEGGSIGADSSGAALSASFVTIGRGMKVWGDGHGRLKLGGALLLREARLSELRVGNVDIEPNRGGEAVTADGITATSEILLEDVNIRGFVCLAGAVAGRLTIKRGRIRMDDRHPCHAFDLSNSDIKKRVILDGLRCWGHVRMLDARVGNLSLTSAEVITDMAECRHRSGRLPVRSIDAVGIQVHNDLDISDLKASNDVFFSNSKVDRIFRLHRTNGIRGRLYLDGMRVHEIQY